MPLRETGSIVVAAPPARVASALEQRSATQVAPGRFESPEGTFVLRETPAGTRVVHARTGSFLRPREDLRHRVEAELFLVWKLLEDA